MEEGIRIQCPKCGKWITVTKDGRTQCDCEKKEAVVAVREWLKEHGEEILCREGRG